MSRGPVGRLRWVAKAAYSRHPAARLFRFWRDFAGDAGAADILLLPLAGLTLTLWVLGTVPGAEEAVRLACVEACLP